MFVKYIILLIIFISSTSIGLLKSKRFKCRVEELKEFKTSLNILKSKISFTYKPLDEIFAEISKTYKKRYFKFI